MRTPWQALTRDRGAFAAALSVLALGCAGVILTLRGPRRDLRPLLRSPRRAQVALGLERLLSETADAEARPPLRAGIAERVQQLCGDPDAALRRRALEVARAYDLSLGMRALDPLASGWVSAEELDGELSEVLVVQSSPVAVAELLSADLDGALDPHVRRFLRQRLLPRHASARPVGEALRRYGLQLLGLPTSPELEQQAFELASCLRLIERPAIGSLSPFLERGAPLALLAPALALIEAQPLSDEVAAARARLASDGELSEELRGRLTWLSLASPPKPAQLEAAAAFARSSAKLRILLPRPLPGTAAKAILDGAVARVQALNPQSPASEVLEASRMLRLGLHTRAEVLDRAGRERLLKHWKALVEALPTAAWEGLAFELGDAAAALAIDDLPGAWLEDASPRLRFLGVLAQEGPLVAGGVARLAKASSDEDPVVRLQAALARARLGDIDSLQALLMLGFDPAHSVAQHARINLEKLIGKPLGRDPTATVQRALEQGSALRPTRRGEVRAPQSGLVP